MKLLDYFIAGPSLSAIAGMATMPSRHDTAPLAIASILPQVDRLWLYLDRFDEVPDFARQDNIHVLRSQECGHYFGSGKFIGALHEKEPCVYICCDDDIAYPLDYADRMTRELTRTQKAQLIGVHGSVFRSSFESYRADRQILHFTKKLARSQHVHTLGSGTVAFNTGYVKFNPCAWTVHDLDDLTLAIEMKRRNIPMIAIKRKRNWLKPLAEGQSDSLFAKLKEDETVPTRLGRLLAAIPHVDTRLTDEVCGPISPEH